MPMIRFGVDRLIQGNPAVNRTARTGMITNDTARLAADASVRSRVALRDAGFNLVRLFGPEHGIAATAADGAAVGDSLDPLTGLPVVSLYGATHRPTAEHLRDLDLVLFDIPDVGARFYTYIWTLSHVLEACTEHRKPLVVLDRPNPIGGEIDACEGPMLDESRYSTFVGRWNIPIRHGLTVGELATLWNAERKIGCDLRVVPAENWTRQMHFPDTGLPWVPTSPAMPSYESALVYPGTCLIEGTNLSEGRETDAPFRLIGAPWVSGQEVATRFNQIGLPGLRAEPTTFAPGGRKHAGERCGGVRIEITHPRAARPVSAGLHLVAILLQLHPAQFEFTAYTTAVNSSGGGHFDRLVGTDAVRLSLLDQPHDASARIDQWTQMSDWEARVRPHLLYPA